MSNGQLEPRVCWRRGDPGYETARRASAWNQRLPDRFPEVIVEAADTDDVVAAVRWAERQGWKIGTRSGGHSWSANHLRDGGLLLDVSRLNQAVIDRQHMRATVGPGCAGHELSLKLARQRLFFPGGHCRGVAVGGYLLQGGYGWHSRMLGPACMSVVGLDLVTAAGEVVFADAEQNADLYWSARGSGPGFFGIVTRFHLQLYRRPRVIGFAAQTFGIQDLERVCRWMHAVGPEVPAEIELQMLLSRHVPGVRGPGMLVVAPVFADSFSRAWEVLRFFQKSPLRRHARLATPFVPCGQRFLYRGVMTHYPERSRYAVDNMWTGAPIDELLPGLEGIARSLPAAPSHLLWMNWAPPPERPSMVYSVEDDIYIALYSVWKHAADDEQFVHWPVDSLRAMQHLSSGCQLADENLAERPQRFLSDEHLRRHEQHRAAYDPQGRFHSWMRLP